MAGGLHDPLVVSTPALARVVRRFLEEINELHGNLGAGHPHPTDGRGISGMAYLVHWSGVQSRRIHGICREETKFTTLDVADKLLTAMELQYLLASDPELAPVPNPQWTREKWEKWRKSCED